MTVPQMLWFIGFVVLMCMFVFSCGRTYQCRQMLRETQTIAELLKKLNERQAELDIAIRKAKQLGVPK